MANGVGVVRSGPSGPPPFDCEGRAKQLREQFRATGGTLELASRWASLRFRCAQDGWEIDGLDGDQPPSKRPFPSPEELNAEESRVTSEAGTTSWPGEVLILVIAILILKAPTVILPVLGEVLKEVLKREGGSVGGPGGSGSSPKEMGESGPTASPTEQPYEPYVEDHVDADDTTSRPGADPDTLPISQGGTLPDEPDE
jgi:hypothetical protein